MYDLWSYNKPYANAKYKRSEKNIETKLKKLYAYYVVQWKTTCFKTHTQRLFRLSFFHKVSNCKYKQRFHASLGFYIVFVAFFFFYFHKSYFVLLMYWLCIFCWMLWYKRFGCQECSFRSDEIKKETKKIFHLSSVNASFCRVVKRVMWFPRICINTTSQ